MKTFVALLVVVAAAVAVPVNTNNEEAVEGLTVGTFPTRVDHFRPRDGRIVDFTYKLNDEFFAPNGPIFIYVNNGGVDTTQWIEGGLVYDVARNTSGALVTADHRYIGANFPTATATLDDLSFLTVDQALADLAALIIKVKEDLATDGPVILWGNGYGGSLATFARKKFPHLVDGVFASSALFRAEAIDNTYYDNLSMLIRQRGSVECADRVTAAFDIFEYLIENRESEYLQERMQLCQPINTENQQEVAAVLYRFIDTIASYIHRNHLSGLNTFCRDLSAINIDPFNSLIRFIAYAYENDGDCINASYDYMIDNLNNTDPADLTARSSLTRAYSYLLCTQIGGLKTTSDFALDVFPADLITDDYQYQFCEDVFGEGYDRSLLEGAVEALNFNYGGQDQIITHVVFSNAGLDPYIHHGIADYAQNESAVVFLENSASGADLRSINAADDVSLAAGKAVITEFLNRWARN